MEILKQNKNELLHREEVEAVVEGTVTPSKKEVLKIISEQFKKPEQNIVIEHIYSSFGLRKFNIIAKIYDSVESKDKYEIISVKERKRKKEEIKKAEEERKRKKEEKLAEEKLAEKTA